MGGLTRIDLGGYPEKALEKQSSRLKKNIAQVSEDMSIEK